MQREPKDDIWICMDSYCPCLTDEQMEAQATPDGRLVFVTNTQAFAIEQAAKLVGVCNPNTENDLLQVVAVWRSAPVDVPLGPIYPQGRRSDLQKRARVITCEINRGVYKIPARVVTGREIRTIGNVPEAHDLYMEERRPLEDTFVSPSMLIPGIVGRRFYSVPRVIGGG